MLQTEHSIEKEVQIVTKNKKYNIIEATVELHRENYIVKKQKYGLYKAGLLLEHPILLQGLGPLPCLMSQPNSCHRIFIYFLYKIYKKAHSERHPDSKKTGTTIANLMKNLPVLPTETFLKRQNGHCFIHWAR